jgi:hypothetical protein
MYTASSDRPSSSRCWISFRDPDERTTPSRRLERELWSPQGRCRCFGAHRKYGLPNLFQTGRRQHERERGYSYFEQQKRLVVIALANVDRSSGKGMASVGGAAVPVGACRRRASQPKFRSMLTSYFTSWVRRQRSTGPSSLRSICRPMASPFGATSPTTCMTNGGGLRPASSSWAVNRASQARCFYRGLESERFARTYLLATPLYRYRDSVSMRRRPSSCPRSRTVPQQNRPICTFSVCAGLRSHRALIAASRRSA